MESLFREAKILRDTGIISFFATRNVKKSEKLMKIVDTQKDNVDTFFSILYFMLLQIFYLQIYK